MFFKCSLKVDKIIEKYLFRSLSFIQVATRRPVTLLTKTPSKVFFKDRAKIIKLPFFIFLNRGTTIFKEHLFDKIIIIIIIMIIMIIVIIIIIIIIIIMS